MGDTHGPDRCSGTQDADEGRTSAQIMAGPHLGANRRENQNLGPRTRMLTQVERPALDRSRRALDGKRTAAQGLSAETSDQQARENLTPEEK
jgi:hypothetical protein